MRFHILTLFPEMVDICLHASILGRAEKSGCISFHTVNIRDYTTDKHKKVDDYTYGGGAGMLMQAQPVYDAWLSVHAEEKKRIRTVYVTPQGRTFTQDTARELAREEELIFLCGHYEGVDERVLEEVATDSISIGDYVLTGGELHNDISAETESFQNGLLEYPQYSRPPVWNGREVPAVLLSGNHAKIAQWRLEQAEKRTRERRPDLYERYRSGE